MIADAPWTNKALLALGLALVGLQFVLPDWVSFLIQVSLASGLVALGVMIQMRAGLVSFGQGLYFCLGGYGAGMAGHFLGVTDAFLLMLIGLGAGGAFAVVFGFLLARYREIFFAMLSLALSMILYGVLVKAEALGSTDGFNLPHTTYLGWSPEGEDAGRAAYILVVLVTVCGAMAAHRYLMSPLGYIGEAIRENEIRVEYLGVSALRVVHIKYIVAALLSSVGGVLSAISIGHVEPEMAYWTTSGQFVFVALLSGTGSVIAPLLGTFALEMVRLYAVEFAPNTWQMILGVIMLLVIIFLPDGLWSLLKARRKSEEG